VPTLVARALSPAKVGSVTLRGEGEERSALVVVPDNQLSLAIGKKGQNARLAAKLTNLRIDVKSETELDDERRRHEEGLAGLAELAPVSAELVQALAAHGFDSPAKVKAAGAAALRWLGELGHEPDAIVAAAEAWLAAREADAANRAAVREDPAGPPAAEAPAPEAEAR
jgi:N utilization substance protein A